MDGPHGSLSSTALDAYDRVILVGGGSGATPLMSILQHACAAQSSRRCVEVLFIWTVKSASTLLWAADELNALSNARGGSVKIDILLYITGTERTLEGSLAFLNDIESAGGGNVTVFFSRPPVDALLAPQKTSSGFFSSPKKGVHPTPSAMLLYAPSSSSPSSPNMKSDGSLLPTTGSDATASGPGNVDSHNTLVIVCGRSPLIHTTHAVAIKHGYDFRNETFQL